MEYEIRSTEVFNKWYKKLKDRRAFKAIANRLIRAVAGNLGDIKAVGNNISEMRIFVGKGYRIYFIIRKQAIIILINGGDKSTQQADIKRANDILKTLRY